MIDEQCHLSELQARKSGCYFLLLFSSSFFFFSFLVSSSFSSSRHNARHLKNELPLSECFVASHKDNFMLFFSRSWHLKIRNGWLKIKVCLCCNPKTFLLLINTDTKSFTLTPTFYFNKKKYSFFFSSYLHNWNLKNSYVFI